MHTPRGLAVALLAAFSLSACQASTAAPRTAPSAGAAGADARYSGTFAGGWRFPDAREAAFGEAKYHRLSQIKGEYDPRNVFAGNQNIRPLVPA